MAEIGSDGEQAEFGEPYPNEIPRRPIRTVKGLVLLYMDNSACDPAVSSVCQSPKVLQLNSSVRLLPAGRALAKASATEVTDFVAGRHQRR